MSVSIHEVAKRAGVSISTVSRVINNSAGVKESKADAVREAMEYYNYEPSQFGRGLVTGSSKMIGVYSPRAGGYMFQAGYYLECLRGIDNVISKSTYSLLLISELDSYYENESQKPKFLEYVNQKKIDGLIVLGIPSDDKMKNTLKTMLEEGFPIAYIGKRFSETGINVYAGYEKYMLKALEELYQKGHRNIFILDAGHTDRRAEQLRDKAMQYLPELNISMIKKHKNIDTAQLTKDIQDVIEKKQITAIICEAMSIVTKCLNILNSLQIKVPDNISIIGTENTLNEGETLIPKINCYYVPALEMGEAVARALHEQLQGDINYEKTHIFTPAYYERDSVKCL